MKNGITRKTVRGTRDRFHDHTNIARHREWRGLKDTAYDYLQWWINLGLLAGFIAKSPVRIVKGLLQYRWMGSYLAALDLVDRETEGLRGPALQTAHIQLHAIVSGVTGIIADMMKADRRFGDNDLADKKVYLEQTMCVEIAAGFPGVQGVLMEMLQGALGSYLDQQLCPYYLDLMEQHGLPADSCRVSSNAVGVALADDYVNLGACLIMNNMPCDSSVMNSQIIDRHFTIPSLAACMPMRWEDEDTDEFAVKQLKKVLKLIEETTGVAFDEKEFFRGMEAHNREVRNDMETWEFIKTPYSACGPAYGLFHQFYFVFSGGSLPAIARAQEKVLKILEKAYRNRTDCFPKTRHRGLIWGGPGCFYVQFANWLYNCWGVRVVMDMFGFEGNVIIGTGSVDEGLRGIAHAYERGGMRRHLTGGYQHMLELWNEAEKYSCDMIIAYDDITCKGALGLTGVINDQCRDHPEIRLMWVQHDMFDPRTISRNEMRRQVNDYMMSVMREEPLDATLLDFNDEKGW